MRLAVAGQMRDRLLAARADGGALAAWAETWGQAVPAVEVGYRLPSGAEGWPFVSLVPVRDVQDLREGHARSLSMAIACGVLSGDQDRDGLGAQAAVDALGAAVVAALADPLVYQVGTDFLVADTCELSDQLYQHPRYQIEQLMLLTNGRGER